MFIADRTWKDTK